MQRGITKLGSRRLTRHQGLVDRALIEDRLREQLLLEPKISMSIILSSLVASGRTGWLLHARTHDCILVNSICLRKRCISSYIMDFTGDISENATSVLSILIIQRRRGTESLNKQLGAHWRQNCRGFGFWEACLGHSVGSWCQSLVLHLIGHGCQLLFDFYTLISVQVDVLLHLFEVNFVVE